MSSKSNLKIALIGNPNAGKTSLFNHLTGLNQKVGNFAGVTVDKKTGISRISEDLIAEVTDLPGLYSLYPRSADEQIVFDFLYDKSNPDYPDLVLVVIDGSNIKRNLFLFSQINDLGLPCILVLTMTDVATESGLSVNSEKLSELLHVPVVTVNARTGKNLFRLKQEILKKPEASGKHLIDIENFAPDITSHLKKQFGLNNTYQALQLAHQYQHVYSISPEKKDQLRIYLQKNNFHARAMQVSETMNRYAAIDQVVTQVLSGTSKETFTDRLDKLFTHRVWGYLIFFVILFVLFQAIFSLSEYPMNFIDGAVASVQEYLTNHLPSGPLTQLLVKGIVAGIGGIIIFVPQITILFAFIAILEETGYMARVMFIMDKFMRKFGLNGKSVVPLISGIACAVPAVMAARSIESRKERLVTVFVTPFMSCSARLPVYALLIALVIPSVNLLGVFNLQGVVLMGLYLLGFITAILSGAVLQSIVKEKGPRSFFILELPSYKMPRWKNVGITIVEKVKSFVFEAGKVIMAISIILMVLSSFGPGNKMQVAETTAALEARNLNLNESDTKNFISSKILENSYAGHFGKFVEPAIKPIGFDWKIGIALIASFAAREVFVATISTIYSLGEDTEDTSKLQEKLKSEMNADTGGKMYTLNLGLSLMIFYAFAMQCMSTIAVVYRETKGWKWPLVQFFYMTALAYAGSFLVFNYL
jgi:ferrous iron transport protein B